MRAAIQQFGESGHNSWAPDLDFGSYVGCGEIMKLRMALVLSFSTIVFQAAHCAEKSKNLTAIGSYSNMRFTKEHQYGSEVHLWRDSDHFVGHFFFSEGLSGDTPIGLIENVEYESKTGAISFSARLTTGQHFCNVHRDVPSRDAFNFKGTLSASSLSGALSRADALHPGNQPVTENVILKKASDDGTPRVYASREAWEAAYREAFKARGPKW
jgi:hypothetical protein